MKAVIFDMDGVIFDTELVWQLAFINANKKFNLTLTEKDRMDFCGKNEIRIREELKKKFPNCDIDGYRDSTLSFVNDKIDRGDFAIKPYFLDFIRFLKNNDYKVILATSSNKSRAEKLFKVKNLNLYSIFDAWIFGEDVGIKSKPDPYIFLIAAEKLSLKSCDCYVVEDSINGIHAAIEGGFHAIMMEDLIPPDDYCKKNAEIFKNFNEIKDMICLKK